MEILLESKRFFEEQEEDFYSEEKIEESLENDEIDPLEQAFMQGYNEAR
jgi:hypothetical protein